MEVASEGSISAPFRVPGLVTIPRDEEEHTFIVVELDADAGMNWYTVPKLYMKDHLEVCPTLMLWYE